MKRTQIMRQPFLWACQNKSHSWKQTNGLQTCLLNHGRPFTGGHSSHALRFGPLGGARRTQMRSSALGVLPQCPCGLILDCDRHTSHCESNFGSFCRGCPTQRSRVPSAFFRVVCRPRLVSLVVLFGGCVAFGALLG